VIPKFKHDNHHFHMEKDSSLTSTVSRQINLDNLTFRPQPVEPSLVKTLSTSHCKVCFKLHPMKSNRHWMHPEEGLDMLICYGCGVTAHKYCYGLKTPVDQYLVSGQKISMFVCEKCQYLGPQCPKVININLDDMRKSIMIFLKKG